MEEILLTSIKRRISNIFIIHFAIFHLTCAVLNKIVMPILYAKPTYVIYICQSNESTIQITQPHVTQRAQRDPQRHMTAYYCSLLLLASVHHREP
jgi:hypothetical protein